MIDPLQEAIDSLRDNGGQWTAYSAVGHCVVIASPGSGKTHLLSTRVASDLAYEVPRPHGAVCVTLTNPAASELRDRVTALNPEWRSTLFVGTVHSFALTQIVRPFARLSPLADVAERRIATSGQVQGSFRAAIGQYYGPGDDTYAVRSTIEFYRKRMVPQAQWPNAEKLILVADRQREILREEGLTDFDELIEAAVQLVEGYPTIREALTSRFPRVYVDEYQDLAPGLDRLVRSICLSNAEQNSTLFAVGDPDQAIFGWTGSRPDLLFNLAAMPEVTKVILDRNYRCGSEIIRIADRLRPHVQVSPRGNDGGSIEARRVEGSIVGQAQAAAHLINGLATRGTALHEIVIICGTNLNCNDVAAVMAGNGIANFVRTDTYRLTPTTILLESLAAWVSFGRESSGYRLGLLLRKWKLIMGDSADFSGEVELVADLLNANPEESASNFASRVLDSGLSRAIQDGDDRNEVNKMMAALGEGDLSAATVRDLGGRARRKDRLEVTTMTSSKGLEFDTVIIIGADQQGIPHYLSLKNVESLNEDRRKFYVSVTRARHSVYIYYSGYVYTKYRTKIDAGPSQFLQEMRMV